MEARLANCYLHHLPAPWQILAILELENSPLFMKAKFPELDYTRLKQWGRSPHMRKLCEWKRKSGVEKEQTSAWRKTGERRKWKLMGIYLLQQRQHFWGDIQLIRKSQLYNVPVKRLGEAKRRVKFCWAKYYLTLSLGICSLQRKNEREQTVLFSEAANHAFSKLRRAVRITWSSIAAV